ncbi:hypothetical protein QBC35DRAFT_387355 [Podospora australis]|uniref:DUF8035 domain-containing protein n=1 Tax=Podospora australis TaxID=1536484 RepID=A0AAN6WRH6_9PEZI|nr:hypothetical protein QBC35DRAFT_387355 [Podospora australis]
MAYRSNVAELSRPERSDRWERDRFELERERDRFSDIRERFEEEDDRYSRRIPSRPAPRERAPSVDRRSRPPPFEDDETIIRERRRVVYDDEPPREMRRRMSPLRRFSPPASEVERRTVIEKERRYRSPSPPRPGRLLRRQSSLDTFDRRHHDDYPPRHDHSVPPYVDMPLPRSRALPPPRVYAERDYFDEISVSEKPRSRFVEEHYHEYPTRVHEKEIVRTRHRSRSRSRVSRVSRRGRSRSSRSSSSSSSSGGTALTAKSEYPKKGKTRIPSRLVSKRALIDLGYPFVEEGNTIIVQKALGQNNIDEVLKLSDEYKKSEMELLAARSSAGDIIEERRTEVVEYTTTAAPAVLHHHHHTPAPSGTGPVIINAQPAPAPPVEVVKTTMIRETSPARSYTTTSYDTTSYGTSTYGSLTSYDSRSTAGPVVIEARNPYDGTGQLAVIEQRRSSRGPDDLRSEIRHLERQLARHERHGSRDLIRAERLPTGELVLFEEEIETIEEPARGGVRVERDKRGRMSISVPRNR